MSEALKMVKAEMGLDAMILSSKKARRKGIMGYFSKPYFEVTAALEPRAIRPNPYREEPVPVVPERELSTREEFQNSMLGPLAREVRELKVRFEAMLKKDALQAAAQPAPQPPQPEPAAEPAQGQAQGPRTFAKEELEEIKRLLYSAVSGKDRQVARPVSFPQADAQGEQTVPQHSAVKMHQHLAQLEGLSESRALSEARPQIAPVPEEQRLIDLLAAELRAEELSPASVQLLMEQIRPAAEDGAGMEELRSLLAETLTGAVKCTGSLRMKKNGPRIMAVVGPTGVGKTTTIAKLAAMHALNRGASVAMVTMDNFRVGAVEQLKTYAKIMDLPLEVAANSQELAKVLAKHADKDLILIDTAGRSPKDAERLDELKGYLECHASIEVYLCLSATTRTRELDELVATFGKLPISKLMFTKLDESESYGCIVDAYLKHKLPLSYFATGQKVPEDIEVATSRKLAAMVLKESTR
jgi:flagellar biosynthesis protein FlhF